MAKWMNLIDKIYIELGHSQERMMRAAEDAMDLRSTGAFETCEESSLVKAKKLV